MMPTDTLTLEQIYALDAAEDIGGGARIDGEPETGNPYEPGPERAAWLTGWHRQDVVERLEQAEARCAELERELDEARAQAREGGE